MKNITIAEAGLSHIDSPFTELFSLLQRYEQSSVGLPMLAYNVEELKTIRQHIDNVADILFQGLQKVGQLMGLVSIISPDQKNLEELSHLGFFISAITNLTEALNNLRLDVSYVLQQQAIERYGTANAR